MGYAAIALFLFGTIIIFTVLKFLKKNVKLYSFNENLNFPKTLDGVKFKTINELIARLNYGELDTIEKLKKDSPQLYQFYQLNKDDLVK